ncbi:CHAT domain-containing protein [Mycena galericulata]|nr:CHAT domain-containing protein [Mycena galericulata]
MSAGAMIAQLCGYISFDIHGYLAALELDFPEVEDDANDIMSCASEILSDFYSSVDLEALDQYLLHPGDWESVRDIPDALLLRFQIRGNAADLLECVDLYQSAYAMFPNRYSCLCAALLTCAIATPDLSVVPESLHKIFHPSSGLQANLLFAKHRHEDAKAIEFQDSGTLLLMEARQSGELTALDSTGEQLYQAQSLMSWGHPRRPYLLDLLATAFQARFQHTGDPNDIEKSAKWVRESLAIRSPHSPHSMHRDRSLSGLGSSLLIGFEEIGKLEYLEEALKSHQEAVVLRPLQHPDRGSSLMLLATAIQVRFKERGDFRDIIEAIEMHRQALELLPSSDPEHSVCQRNLGVALRTKYEHSGEIEHIDEAVARFRAALELPSNFVERNNTLNNLANTLRIRSEQTGNSEDIDEAIALNQTLLELRPAPNPYRGNSLNNLANAFSIRFSQRGDLGDIHESTRLHRETVDLRPFPHRERAASLDNLGSAIATRFFHMGDPKDIDEVIRLNRDALDLRPSPHPDRGGALHNLAASLITRFDAQEDPNDITEALNFNREALRIFPEAHIKRPLFLGSLASTLCTRFSHTNELKDINEAIKLNRELVALNPAAHPEHGKALANLGASLNLRFKHQGHHRDIDESVILYRSGLAMLKPTPLYHLALNDMCGALLDKISCTGNFRGIQEVILLESEALTLLLAPHPHRGNILVNLAHTLLMADKHSRNVEYVEQAFNYLQEASTYSPSPPLARFHASCRWARLGTQHNHHSSIDAYRAAITLLPQVAALHLDIQSRRERLTKMECINLVSRAANCAIELEKYDVAVEFLETSRSVFWSQARNLRISLDDLRCSGLLGSQLATRLSQLSTELQNVSFRDTARDFSTDIHEKIITIEAEGVRTRRLNQEWEDAITSVRNLSGFEDFMQPKPISSLRNAAVHGPVVILVPGEHSSHALVVCKSQEVECVPLRDANLDWLYYQVRLLRQMSRSKYVDMDALIAKLLPANHSGGRDGEALVRSLNARLTGMRESGGGEINANGIFGELLAALWEAIVKPIFNGLQLKKTGSPSRIWWCPTGQFAFLPIHAAGLYGTLAKFTMTAVIQPESSFAPLPGTRTELERIKQTVPAQWLTAMGDDTQATAESALLHLQQSSLVHFAGHGLQDSINPLDSGLILTDGLLKISEIMRNQASIENKTPHSNGHSMSLAFLSACETATGDPTVPDEAMHLAAALLFAGFRGVVATMWSIQDTDGPTIAGSFYNHLFRNCKEDPPVPPELTEAAEALHIAVGLLRADSNIPFMRWVPFVHYGFPTIIEGNFFLQMNGVNMRFNPVQSRAGCELCFWQLTCIVKWLEASPSSTK